MGRSTKYVKSSITHDNLLCTRIKRPVIFCKINTVMVGSKNMHKEIINMLNVSPQVKYINTINMIEGVEAVIIDFKKEFLIIIEF